MGSAVGIVGRIEIVGCREMVGATVGGVGEGDGCVGKAVGIGDGKKAPGSNWTMLGVMVGREGPAVGTVGCGLGANGAGLGNTLGSSVGSGVGTPKTGPESGVPSSVRCIRAHAGDQHSHSKSSIQVIFSHRRPFRPSQRARALPPSRQAET